MPWGWLRSEPADHIGVEHRIPLASDSLHQIDSVASRFVDKHMPIG